jgi:hypothetical protein
MDVNGEDATGPLPIAFTFNASDPVAWRQWHHWNIIPGVIRVRLPAGKNVLTVHVSYRREYESCIFRLQGVSIAKPGLPRFASGTQTVSNYSEAKKGC